MAFLPLEENGLRAVFLRPLYLATFPETGV
jgi:hypothetical protein